jgi:hypothetical protein
MSHTENNLSVDAQVHTTDTQAKRQEQHTLPTLQQLLRDYDSHWFSIKITNKGCYVQFRTKSKDYHFGEGATLHIAYQNLCSRLNSFYNSKTILS